MQATKYLVVWAHYANPKSDKNLNFFIANGLVDSPEVKFCFVFQKDSRKVIVPKQSNVQVLHGDNVARDFGAWELGISAQSSVFDNYIFVNCSNRGPFIPKYCDTPWYKMFCSLLSESTKLVGPTDSPVFTNHLQSQCFATDTQGLQILRKTVLNRAYCEKTHRMKKQYESMVMRHELQMSRDIRKAGYRIESFLPSQSFTVDVWGTSRLFNMNPNVLSLMFYKTNRHPNEEMERFSLWAASPSSLAGRRNVLTSDMRCKHCGDDCFNRSRLVALWIGLGAACVIILVLLGVLFHSKFNNR